MYDTYTRMIYDWLRETFFPYFQSNIQSILSKLDFILTFIKYGLYLGTFAFLFWVAFTFVRPHFFKV